MDDKASYCNANPQSLWSRHHRYCMCEVTQKKTIVFITIKLWKWTVEFKGSPKWGRKTVWTKFELRKNTDTIGLK